MVKNRRVIVKDPRFRKGKDINLKGRGKVWKYIFIIFSLLLVVSIGALAGGMLIKKNIENSYDRFREYANLNEYSKAMKTYRDTKEGILSTSKIDIFSDLRKKQVDKMEEDITGLITGIFDVHTKDFSPLSTDEITILSAFSEISINTFHHLFQDYLSKGLKGENTQEDGEEIIKIFSDSVVLKDYLMQISKEIPDIYGYQERFAVINNYLEDKEYSEFLDLVFSDLETKQGFIKLFLNNYINTARSEVMSSLLDGADLFIAKGKYYSGKYLLSDLNRYFPDNTDVKNKLEICNKYTHFELEEYTMPVPHFAIRPLISDERFVFGRGELSLTAEDVMLTKSEFRLILEELYANSYVLIDIESLVDKFGKLRPVLIPKGKKPIMLSVEGLNYYASRRLSGNCINLHLSDKGEVLSEYYGNDGKLKIDGNGEAIGILENFIKEYPDFSFDGAKGNISLTGYECIFGYITDWDQFDARLKAFDYYGLGNFHISEAEILKNKDKVREIVEALKKSGWTFSSSTYGNISVAEMSLDNLRTDTVKWFDRVGELTGETKTLLFPNGSIVSSKDERGKYLIEKGFTIQCGIGPAPYFNKGERHLYMDRIPLNGYALRNTDLSDYFDVTKIYDSKRSKKLNKQ